MASTKVKESSYLYEPPVYQQKLEKIMEDNQRLFIRLSLKHAFFSFSFIQLIFLELMILIFAFPFFLRSAFSAFFLALVFFTFFSYFFLRLYMQSRRGEQFKEIGENFLVSCKKIFRYQEGILEDHLVLADACRNFSSQLAGKESRFYPSPRWCNFLVRFFKRLSEWWHWEDVHQIQEMCLLKAIEENLKLVRCEPLSFEAHAALANGYVTLSSLYTNRLANLNNKWHFFIDPKKEILKKSFRTVSEKAIEEFKIMRDFAPENPWVREQLAYSYRDLKMPEEEILEYEAVLALSPLNHDVLFKLGVLYFGQGWNAKGLKVYEQLRKVDSHKANQLIPYYGKISFLQEE